MAVFDEAAAKLNEYLQTAQHRSYFIAFVTLVFIFIMVVFGILPAYSAFLLQGVENQKRADAIEKLKKKRDDLQKLTLESQQKEDILAYFDFVFPKTPDQDEILNQMIQLADRSFIFLKNINFQENNQLQREFQPLALDPAVQSLSLSILAEGSQQTLNSFIGELENQRKIYNIKNFIITRKSSQDIQRTTPDKYYDLNLQLNIYYFAE